MEEWKKKETKKKGNKLRVTQATAMATIKC